MSSPLSHPRRRAGRGQAWAPWKRQTVVLGLCLVAVVATRFALEEVIDQFPNQNTAPPPDIPSYEEVMGASVEVSAGDKPGREDGPGESRPPQKDQSHKDRSHKDQSYRDGSKDGSERH